MPVGRGWWVLWKAIAGLDMATCGVTNLVRWQPTFLVWLPVWPPRFQVIILFLFTFSFPRMHNEMNEC